MGCLEALPLFPAADGLPGTSAHISSVLKSPMIKTVRSFALGPEGTNIAQACRRWIKRMGVGDKSEVILCDSPEFSVAAARSNSGDGVLGVFWTCAVFNREMNIFFGNPDSYPFFSQEVMRLDDMQLATRPELAEAWSRDVIPSTWRIASHPSPTDLVRPLPCVVVPVSSNSEAAIRCAAGDTEGCVTTESARAIHGLVKLHSFGSPRMVFFAGITGKGAEMVKRIYADLQHGRQPPFVQDPLGELLEGNVAG